MNVRLWIIMIAATVAVAIGSMDYALARGGRGGGGFGGGAARGGGFGGAARPGGGFSGGSRPSVGSSPSFNRPNTGAVRPVTPTVRPSDSGNLGGGNRPNVSGENLGSGNRPSTQPNNRPATGIGSGSRPSTLPSKQPGAGSGIGTRPVTGNTINNNRVGVATQPARLPGLGSGTTGSRLPNQGAGLQDRVANRLQTLDERRGNLSDRMSSGREDWQSHRQDMQGNRQDWRDNNREDWQNWADHHIDHHGDWYHGCWHGGWYPGAGWGYMWNNYPVATAFGLTAWGVNRVAYGWGYWGYVNPYYVPASVTYNYSQPIVVYSDSGTSTSDGNTATSLSQPSDETTAVLTAARVAFSAGDSAKALTLLDTVLKSMPNDTAVHEFRGLVLFSLKKYPEAAAATYAVLSAGPGWDWTTMSGLYSSVDEYTKQLRALEEFARANPKSSDAHFLLGYHYLTTGFAENASKQFKLAQLELPNDRLLKQLVGMTTPPDESKSSDASTLELPAVPPEKVLKTEQLVGTWKATSQGSSFELVLAKDGSFTWTYSRGKEKQSVKGVFAVDQNNLALETDDGGGTMLAEVDFANPSQFQFKMIGDSEKDPGLQFKKS